MLCGLLAELVLLCVLWPQQSPYMYQISAGGRMSACRNRHSHQQMCSDAVLIRLLWYTRGKGTSHPKPCKISVKKFRIRIRSILRHLDRFFKVSVLSWSEAQHDSNALCWHRRSLQVLLLNVANWPLSFGWTSHLVRLASDPADKAPALHLAKVGHDASAQLLDEDITPSTTSTTRLSPAADGGDSALKRHWSAWRTYNGIVLEVI